MGCLSHHGTDHADGAAGGHEGEGEVGGEESGAVTPSTNHAPRRPRPARPSVHRQRESTTSCTLIDWQRQLKSQSVTLLVTGYTAVLHHWDSNLNFLHCHQEERKTWSNMIAFEGPFAFASGRNRSANGTRTPFGKRDFDEESIRSPNPRHVR